MTLGELIEVLGGKLVQGDPEMPILFVRDPTEANPWDLVFAEDAASAAKAFAGGASAVVLKPGCADPRSWDPDMCVVETNQPRLWFAKAGKLLKSVPPAEGVHPTAVIGERVELGEGVTVGAGVVLGDVVRIGAGSRIEAGAVIGAYVSIGENCHIHPRVTMYHGTQIGNRVVVHAGAVLGADGFGYVRDAKTGAYTQFPQQGTLLIEDDVEIGANSTIDRGALKQTRIGRGTKIDNLVHIGHNCRLGENVVIAAQTGLSGSIVIENDVVLGGQVGIGEHARIEEGVMLGGQGGVLPNKVLRGKGVAFWGTPAQPVRQYLKQLAALARLSRKKDQPK